jgi:lysophospholipase L1-like esterase
MKCLRRQSDTGAVVVGDSVSLGSSDPAWGFLAEDSWVAQMTCDGRPKYGYNAAKAGTTTEQMRASIAKAVRGRRPTWCVVLGGTNDLIQGRPASDVLADLSAIVDSLIRACGRVAIGTVPPLRGRSVGALNDGIAALARGRAVLIDFHAALVGPDGYAPGLGHGDGIHPSVAGARRMARAAEAALG